MQYKCLIGVISLIITLPVLSVEQGNDTLKRLETCKKIISSLERLDCYDQTWENTVKPILSSRSNSWVRATEQEKDRSYHSVNFLTTKTEKDDASQVIITTPALGLIPPRPILMLSCIDNITRFQLILHQPIMGRELPVSIQTDRTMFESHWLSRDGGYILEASRGLQGINEIQKLFGANKMTLKIKNQPSKEWNFNIENLEQEIIPFRQACHW